MNSQAFLNAVVEHLTDLLEEYNNKEINPDTIAEINKAIISNCLKLDPDSKMSIKVCSSPFDENSIDIEIAYAPEFVSESNSEQWRATRTNDL